MEYINWIIQYGVAIFTILCIEKIQNKKNSHTYTWKLKYMLAALLLSRKIIISSLETLIIRIESIHFLPIAILSNVFSPIQNLIIPLKTRKQPTSQLPLWSKYLLKFLFRARKRILCKCSIKYDKTRGGSRGPQISRATEVKNAYLKKI